MYPIVALLAVMFLTWGIAVWATVSEDDNRAASSHEGARELKKAA